jgi:uncharacterized membrane protein YqjE
MATVLPRPSEDAHDDGVFTSLGRLAQLEFELGLTETRRVLVGTAIAVGVAVAAAVALIASLVVLLAAALAPLFDSPWEHLLVAGAGVFLLAALALVWSVQRLTTLEWPRLTRSSLAENWQWLEAQLRSRLTLR